MHDASTTLVPSDRTDETGDRSGGRDWRDRSLSASERARLLTAELTLEEKAAQLGSVWLTDSACAG